MNKTPDGKMIITADSRLWWKLSDLLYGSDHAHEEVGDEKFIEDVIDRIIKLRKKSGESPQKPLPTVEEYLGSIIEEDPGESLEDYKFPTCREDIEGKPPLATMPKCHLCHGTGMVDVIGSFEKQDCPQCNQKRY